MVIRSGRACLGLLLVFMVSGGSDSSEIEFVDLGDVPLGVAIAGV